ncbi:MAG TPA: ABC transporter substrate-binding protein [Thermodesulfobacteriota bacterium]|nr:ABC transporter substrate-binding protein [Thermodesulfobacteriota bacterium]
MRRSLVVLGLAALVAAAGFPAPAGAQAPRKIKLTMPVVALSMTPVYLAEARGYFAEEGLAVERISTGGGGPDIRALIAGEADFTFTPGDNVLLAYQEGKRLVMVMSGLHRLIINWAMHRDVARARGITETTPLPEKLKALKGLTVGVTQPGALTAHLATFVVRKAGYEPQRDVQIIPIGAGPTWLAALENRKVDVALTATPVPETAVARGYAIMFLNNARGEDPSIPEFLMENLITRPEVIERDPELVRKMVRALVRANRWALSAPPEQVAEALKPFLTGTPPETLLAGVRATLPALNPDGRTTERAVQVTQDVLEQAGLLKRRVPYGDVVTNEFLPR